MKKVKDYTGLVVLLAVGILGGAAFFFNSSTDKVEQTTAPIVVETPVVEEPIWSVIELPEVVIVGRTNTEPFRSGTEACHWYEDAGMRAVASADGWAESTCSGNTCFLLVHEAGLPAGWIMAAWVSEARDKGHDPRKEQVELSVFTFDEAGKETDHIIYFPDRDVFEQ